MQRISLNRIHILALVIAGALATGPALADKPSKAGGPKAEKQGQQESHPSQHDKGQVEKGSQGKSTGGARVKVHFGDQHRSAIHDYYAAQFRSGRCPPGLAKKQNGCMPPGLAKKWVRGRPLPPDVIFYDLPHEVLVHLGTPPTGHRFVRVASDILMIAVGTGLVVDAIEDLGRL